MRKYMLTIFLGAFLLFQVQPLIGKFILPWFGGTPAVWTTCLLFFQSLLLVGYAYAHGVAQQLRPRWQLAVHLALLGGTLLLLPIAPSAAWKPAAEANPTWNVLLLLAVSVGAPYLVLASTSPLVQSWFNRRHPGRSPYWLYALSNIGSLLGLFTYPFLVERLLPLQTQTTVWTALYVLFLALYVWCTIDSWKGKAATSGRQPAGTNPPAGRESARQTTAAPRPSAALVALWLALSACGSVMLLATTNLMCQDVAPVPFLWVLPLSLYLLSFILFFGNDRWYRRDWCAVALIVAVALSVIYSSNIQDLNLIAQIAMYCFVLTACCFVCHGELVKLKPAPRHLTLFYLIVSAGGALGGVLVSLVAPQIFTGYAEYYLGLAACAVLLVVLYRRDRWSAAGDSQHTRQIRWAAASLVAVGTVVSGGAWTYSKFSGDNSPARIVDRQRNFYGSLTIVKRTSADSRYDRVVMTHGNTAHGFQFLDPERRQAPTMYYQRQSGIGLAIESHPNFRDENRPLRLGVVGLGAGTLCCYARSGDYVRFYEIDPLVIELAERHFTFQHDARRRGADVDVFLGDGRLVMERQLARGEAQRFDVLAVDAFSSDAIPLHLLTRECFEIYLKHLRPDGILAVHISNRHLDLSPVVRTLAAELGHTALWICRPLNGELLRFGNDVATGSQWVLITQNREFLGDETVQRAAHPWPADGRRVLWTDNFSSLFQLLRTSG